MSQDREGSESCVTKVGVLEYTGLMVVDCTEGLLFKIIPDGDPLKVKLIREVVGLVNVSKIIGGVGALGRGIEILHVEKITRIDGNEKLDCGDRILDPFAYNEADETFRTVSTIAWDSAGVFFE